MSIRSVEPASLREPLVQDRDYSHFGKLSRVLVRQSKHCDEIYGHVYHPLKADFERALVEDKIPLNFEAEELEEDDIGGCCCWGTHKVCSAVGKAVAGAFKYLKALWAWICVGALYVQYGYNYATTNFDGKFEKDLEEVLDKMKQVASVSDKPITSQSDAIKLNQRVHIERLLPKLCETFLEVLDTGTPFEKKRALAKLRELLTPNFWGHSDSDIVWMISETNMPTLGQVLLLGNRELGVEGLLSDPFVRELLENDDYFVAAALDNTIAAEDFAACFLAPTDAPSFTDVLFGLLPDWTRMEVRECYEESGRAAGRAVKRLDHRLPKGHLPLVFAESDEPVLLDEVQKGNVLASYMDHKLRHDDAMDAQTRARWVKSFKGKSKKKRNAKLNRHMSLGIERQIAERYVEIIHATETLPALRKAINEKYPLELRAYMPEEGPTFEEQTAITIAHLNPSEFMKIFYRDRVAGTPGLIEMHRLAVLRAKEQLAPSGRKVPKSWHPTSKKINACATGLIERCKELRLNAYNKAHYLAKRYVEQLKYTREKSADFQIEDVVDFDSLEDLDIVDFGGVASDEDEASEAVLGLFARPSTPPPQLPSRDREVSRGGYVGRSFNFATLHQEFDPELVPKDIVVPKSTRLRPSLDPLRSRSQLPPESAAGLSDTGSVTDDEDLPPLLSDYDPSIDEVD